MNKIIVALVNDDEVELIVRGLAAPCLDEVCRVEANYGNRRLQAEDRVLVTAQIEKVARLARKLGVLQQFDDLMAADQ